MQVSFLDLLNIFMVLAQKKIEDDFDDIDFTPLKGYQGNKNLKKKGEQISWTKELLKEYKKCANDIVYFARKYYKIVHVDDGLIPVPLCGYQEDLLRLYQKERFVTVIQARQSFKTTTTAIFILWYVLFNDYKTVGILANKGSTAREILGRIQLAYEYLPKWLQQGVEEWNKGSFELENGSRVLAAATSSSAIRGMSLSLCYIDEAAFIHKNTWDEFFTSIYPTISSGKKSKLFMTSTPNGYNHFYKIVSDARSKKSAFHIFEVTWRDVPGRDEAWKAETIRNTSEQQFMQEHECHFIGSSNTLIPMNVLNTLVEKEPFKISQDIKIYEDVKENEEYAIVADVSEGVGGDYHAVSVISVSHLPYRQVATYRNNMDSPSGVLPEILHGLSKLYNDAAILIETNISVGGEVAKILHEELENENVIMTSTRGRKGQTISSGFGNTSMGYGVRMTKSVKRVGCSKLKDLVEMKQLLIHDFETISELSTFVKVRDSFAADSTNNDDMVMGLVMFAWLTTQEYFKQLNDEINRRKLYEEQLKAIEEDLTPLGIFPDNYDSEDEFSFFLP